MNTMNKTTNALRAGTSCCSPSDRRTCSARSSSTGRRSTSSPRRARSRRRARHLEKAFAVSGMKLSPFPPSPPRLSLSPLIRCSTSRRPSTRPRSSRRRRSACRSSAERARAEFLGAARAALRRGARARVTRHHTSWIRGAGARYSTTARRHAGGASHDPRKRSARSSPSLAHKDSSRPPSGRCPLRQF